MNRIRELRKSRGLTQVGLAGRLGVSQGTVSAWEAETVQLDIETLKKLSDLFGVSTDYLLGRDEEPAPASPAPASEWNVEYPPGVALSTARPPVAPAPSVHLSDADINEIARRVAGLNEDAKASPVLSKNEQQLIEEYRMLSGAGRIRVQRLIAQLLDAKFLRSDTMKKLLALFLALCLLLSCAWGEEARYYPFGITADMSYEDALGRVLLLYSNGKERVLTQDSATYIVPDGFTLFDTPIYYISVSPKDGGWDKLAIYLRDDLKNNGLLSFLDAFLYLNEHLNLPLLLTEPYTVTYDLSGNPIVKTFLDDIDGLITDYMTAGKEMELMFSWDGVYLNFRKTGERYDIRMMFLNEAGE